VEEAVATGKGLVLFAPAVASWTTDQARAILDCRAPQVLVVEGRPVALPRECHRGVVARSVRSIVPAELYAAGDAEALRELLRLVKVEGLPRLWGRAESNYPEACCRRAIVALK
jgi:hypothetical protein